jgi:hypothetical protein
VSVEERRGTLDRVTEKGILISGARLSYSKWFEGDRPTEDLLGCQIRVIVDAGDKVSFLKKILGVDGKAPGWKPPENPEKGSPGGPGRRLSPEELALKVDEGIRIARSVAIDRAIMMVDKGISIDQIGGLAPAIEAYILKGVLPEAAKAPEAKAHPKEGDGTLPSASPPKSVPKSDPESARPAASAKEALGKAAKPRRLPAKLVSGLFNEALRGGLVEDWPVFLELIEGVLKVEVKNPYQMNSVQYARVEAVVRQKLGQGSAA